MSPDAYATLAYYGRLRADPAHVDPYFVPAYDWMRDQMAKRVAVHTGDYPIWLWAKIRRDDLVSSVRLAARHQPGTVLVTCRIAPTAMSAVELLGLAPGPQRIASR